MTTLREEFEQWWGSQAPDERKGVAWEAWKASARAEREACAMKVIASPGIGRYDLATAIRARGDE